MKLKVFLNSYGEHLAMVNGKGRDITDADLIAAAANCGVVESEVKSMIATIEAAQKEFLSQ